MTFFVGTAEHCARVAASLSVALARRGYHSVRLGCDELVARMHGFGSLAEAAAARSANPPSSDDDHVGSLRARRRRAQAIHALVAIDVTEADASAIVDEIRPTGGAPAFDSAAFAPLSRQEVHSLGEGLPRLLRRLRTERGLLALPRNEHALLAARKSVFFAALTGASDRVVDDMVVAFADLHARGCGVDDLAAWTLRDIGASLSAAVAEGRVSARRRDGVLQALSGEIVEVSEIDRVAGLLLDDILERTAVGAAVVEAAIQGQAAGRSCAIVTAADLRAVSRAGATLADYAVALSESRAEEQPTIGDPAFVAVVDEGLAALPRAIGPMDYAAADAAQADGMCRLLDRGANSAMLEMLADQSLCRRIRVDGVRVERLDGSRVLGEDLLACAHRAGLTLADLAASVLRGIALCVRAYDRTDPEAADMFDLEELRRTVALRAGAGRPDADLVRFAFAAGMAVLCPGHGGSFHLVDALRRIHGQGGSLADLAVVERPAIVPLLPLPDCGGLAEMPMVSIAVH